MIAGLNWREAREYAAAGISIRRAAWLPDGTAFRWLLRPRVNGRMGALWYDEVRNGTIKTISGVCTAASMLVDDFEATDWMADYDTGMMPGNPVVPGQPGNPLVPIQPGFPSTPPIVDPEKTVLLQEDFRSITKGMDGDVAGSILAWYGNENFPIATKAYQAGGVVKLGAGLYPGSIESKLLDLSLGGGVFTVKFKVKGWTYVEGGIQVSATGLAPQIVYYTATLYGGGSYDELTVSFVGGQADSRVKIATTEKRAFIDDVLIVAG